MTVRRPLNRTFPLSLAFFDFSALIRAAQNTSQQKGKSVPMDTGLFFIGGGEPYGNLYIKKKK